MFYITSLSEFCESNKRDDAKRDAGLKTPDDVQRFDDIRYSADHPRNVLDVYRPKGKDGKLPVIVSVHGGGWVYGDKELMQFYCMSLAQRGFAVVNFSYRMSPEFKHPAPIEDADKVFRWIFDNADKYGLDTRNIFAVGDSVGANILGLYCCLCIDGDYADRLNVHPLKGFVPSAVALNSGLYRLVRGEELLLDSLAEAYLPNGGTDEEYAWLDLGAHLKEGFPPCYVMTANGDFLMPQAKPFYDMLISHGVDAEYHCYGDDETVLTHVFHVNMKLDAAKKCNSDECAFFEKHTKGE